MILECVLMKYDNDTLLYFNSFVFVGVYLSKYSDLLQINPLEVGSSGDMIVFKVMRVWLPFCFHFIISTDF